MIIVKLKPVICSNDFDESPPEFDAHEVYFTFRLEKNLTIREVMKKAITLESQNSDEIYMQEEMKLFLHQGDKYRIQVILYLPENKEPGKFVQFVKALSETEVQELMRELGIAPELLKQYLENHSGNQVVPSKYIEGDELDKECAEENTFDNEYRGTKYKELRIAVLGWRK